MANNDLKRVGLIFTEEGAKDFKKTLQDINIEMNKNYNQFKLTQSQWDNSTKSTEKLTAQQEYLTNAYEIQSDKVNVLKMQLADLENAENKNTTAIKKKQNELTNAEIKLKNYESKLKDIQAQLTNTSKKLEEWGEKVEKSGKKIENAGKNLSAFSAASISALTLSAKSAIDFEDAFAGVEKTVDGTKEQMEELKQGIRDMAKEMPSSTTEIAAVAEAAGQLGIKTENILDFSKAMIDLGNSTNLTADEAASQLAKFANITQMSQKDFDKLGSTIVDLGNKYATTEADIVSMAMRLAGAGKQVGFSEAEILGLATALSSVGIEAEMGGSAISKAMVKMQNAVEQGGTKLDTVLKKTGMTLRELELMSANDSRGFKELSQSIGMTSTEVKQLITAGTNLEDFAKVSGMTTEQFKKAWKEDAAGALSEFIKGLGDAENKGESAITMLSEMGLTEVRLRDSLLRAANAGTLFNDAINTGTQAWKNNTALTNEANKRYDTLKSKIKIAINKLKDMAITLGNKLMPSIEKVIEGLGKWIDKFSKLSDKQVDMIVKIGLIVASIGPLVAIIGKVTSAIGGTVKGIGTFTQAIGVMRGSVTTTDTAVNGLAKIIQGLSSPVGIAITSIGALASAYIWLRSEAEKIPEELQRNIEEMEKVKKTHEEYREELDKTASSSLAEIKNTEDLRNELSNLVDENGKVKEGYKDRVSVILNELNKALGTEYTLTGDVINQYKTLQEEIDLLILKKKAQIILENEESKYSTAIQNKTSAYKDMINAQNEYNKALEGKTYEQYFNDLQQKYIDAGYTAKKSAEHAKDYMSKWVDGYKETFESYQTIYNDYLTDIAKYENDYAIMQSNNTDKIKKMTDERISNYGREKLSREAQIQEGIQQEIYNIEELKKIYQEDLNNKNEISAQANANAIESSNQRLQTLLDELTAQTSTINENSPEVINAWKELATSSYATYYERVSKMPPELSKKIQEMTGVTAERTPELVKETENMMSSVLDEIEQNAEFKSEAIKNLNSFLSGLSDSELKELLEQAGIEDVDKVMEGIKKGNLSEEQGKNILSGLNSGLNNKSWKDSLWSTARGIASKLSGLLTVKARVNGATSKLPGHKLGLDYVPKDNYVARLHKGERVLTKEENEAYTQAEENGKRKNLSKNSITNQEIDYGKMASAFLSALNKCKLTLDEDGFARIVKNELYEVL